MHSKSTNPAQSQFARRRGVVLFIVLIVIVLLALATYGFTELSLAEMESAAQYSREVEARCQAESALEYLAVAFADPAARVDTNLFHNPEYFQNKTIETDSTSEDPPRFTVIAPLLSDPQAQRVRYGVMDESGKLNLNAILKFDMLDEIQHRDMLMALPGMTENIADAILDWMDDDTDIREFGVEGDYYLTLPTPYDAADGPLKSLEELLKVRDVTPQLLFGEDANRNGLLDPNENDGEASPPFDNADGFLDRGWAAFLTVRSSESNLQLDGETPKIDVNNPDLIALYDEIAEFLDEDTARFIIAYRAYGPMDDGTLRSEDISLEDPFNQPTLSEREAMDKIAEGVAKALFSAEGISPTRGGLKSPLVARYSIGSLYDVFDTVVEAETEMGLEQITSPWSASGSDLPTLMVQLTDLLSTTSSEKIEGRININQAPKEVLMTIPSIPEVLADNIVNSALIGSAGEPVEDTNGLRATTAWLLIEGIADIETMRLLDQFMTSGGDVYRMQVVGHFARNGPVVRLEGVIDYGQLPPRIIELRDLSHLGSGYRHSQLTPPVTE